MTKLTGAALDRAVANAMGLKSVNNCEKWGKEMTHEDEEFSRLEMESKVRREYALQALHDENERLGLYKDAYEEKPTRAQLIAEVAILSELVMVLNTRVIKLEAELKK